MARSISLTTMRTSIRSGPHPDCASASALYQIPGFAARGFTKIGLVALTKVAAPEGAGSAIRVDCGCPGPIAHTRLSDNLTS